MEDFAILIHKEYFKFSCAHFLIFSDGSKERLHGHNYQVSCEIGGELSDRGLVIDFKLVKPIVRQMCDDLDEHWLIPGEHHVLTYQHRDDGHTEVQYMECHYLAPTEEVIVLPINNTSAENLAGWFGRNLVTKLREEFGSISVRTLRFTVSETSGQHGVYTYADD
jgi:6-pyruvoyltetrahydropterin/6-carboxytetrahydropterin synthase